MSQKRAPTFADYLVIAITPALIMLLIGALVFFLLTAFYGGAFPGRLRYIAALFVFAAVLVGRISIEEGIEQAVLFGIPLALATWLTLSRFTDASSLVILGVIAITWWSAHKLTWDCTVIDDREDATGEGLLQAAGLDTEPPRDADSPSPDQQLERDTESAARRHDEQRGARLLSRIADWWQQRVESRRRPHAPGLWVIYFTLATLPLFGVGQWAIPVTELSTRQSAFHCLLTYVASALALLGTTSFLGIRRYLRQRRLQMPADMAMLWAAVAGALIFGILLVCSFLPRPRPEYSLTTLLDSPDGQRTHRFWFVPREGVPSDHAAANGPQTAGQEESQSNESSSESPSSQEQRLPEDLQRAPTEEPTDSSAPPRDGSSAESSPADRPSQPGAESPHVAPAATKDGNDREPRSASAQDRASGTPGAGTSPPGRGSESGRPPPAKNADSPRAVPRQPTSLLQSLALGLGQLLRWLYWAILLAIALYVLVRYGRAIVAALARFWTDLWKIWGERAAQHDAVPSEPDSAVPAPRRPFSSFRDPWDSHPPLSHRALIHHVFQALEAWGCERDIERTDDQTPHEFARQIITTHPEMQAGVRHLVQLYAHAAYGPGRLPDVMQGRLRQLWQQMHGRTLT